MTLTAEVLEMDARVALLDFDGLVIDTEFAGWRSWHELFESRGLKLSVEDWASQCGRAALYEPWDQIEANPGELDRDVVRQTLHRRRDEFLDLLPGVRKFVMETRRRGYQVGLVSNSPVDWITRNLTRNGLDPTVFAVVICGDAFAPKPSPERYLAALESLGITANEAIAVEDSAKGIEAAVAAGLRCVAVPNRITCHSNLSAAHYMLQSIDQLRLRTELAEQ